MLTVVHTAEGKGSRLSIDLTGYANGAYWVAVVANGRQVVRNVLQQ